MLVRVFTGLVLIVFVACGSTCGTTVPGGGNTSVSFSNDIQPIFDAKCARCHGAGDFGNTAPNLTSGQAYAAIVNQPAGQKPTLPYIQPGSASSSWLFIKVSDDTPGSGSRMPNQGGFLSDAEITLIQTWINAGASNN